MNRITHVRKTTLLVTFVVAFAAGSLLTAGVAAQPSPRGTPAIVGALNALVDAVLDVDITVPADAIQVDVVGVAGPQGPQGPPGSQGPQGLQGPEGPAATLPDPPCFDNANRYVDCLNGTVTDTVTGLIWLQQADCLGFAAYAAANEAAAALENGDCDSFATPLMDGSSAGDWRLPTKEEWEVMLAQAVALGCSVPSLTNDAGTGCFAAGGASFAGVASEGAYWSSASSEVNPFNAWFAGIVNGFVVESDKDGIFSFRVWPVRSGSR